VIGDPSSARPGRRVVRRSQTRALAPRLLREALVLLQIADGSVPDALAAVLAVADDAETTDASGAENPT